MKTVKAEINDAQIQSVIISALKFGIESIRPVYMTVCAAQYLAGRNDRKRVEQEDLNLAASLILAHRALLIPEEIQNDAETQPPTEQEETANKETNQENNVVFTH